MGDIAKTSLTRVWLIECGAHIAHAPSYKSCLRMTALSQGFGDIEPIECPSPTKYDSFDEVGQIRGANERPTTTLEGRYMLDLTSDLLRLAGQGLPFDVQLHMGVTQNPSAFDEFEKALILEDAYPTNFSTEDLGALQSGDTAAINESADISAKKAYEVVPLTAASKASSTLTNEVVDIMIYDTPVCSGSEYTNGCKKIYAVTLGAGGSPSTPADIVFSLDGGVTWYAHDIDTLTAAQHPSAIAGFGSYVIVSAIQANNLNYVLKEDLNAVEDPAWTSVTTGFVAARQPRAMFSVGNYLFIVGNGGYIYGTADPTASVTVLDAGVAVTDDLLCVHALSENFAVACGNNGAVVYTTDGTTWNAVSQRPTGAAVHLNTIWAIDEKYWMVGTSTGRLYYTLDGGISWTEKTFSGSGSGVVYSIKFASKSVGYMSHSTSTPRARILRTFNGGNTWKLVPEKSGTLPAGDRLNEIAVCEENVNFFAGGGLADDAADGFILIGEGA